MAESAKDRTLRLIQDQLLDCETFAIMVVKYLSEDECEEMLDMNELSERFDYEEYC